MRLLYLQPQTAAIVIRTGGGDIGPWLVAGKHFFGKPIYRLRTPWLVAARRGERPSCGGKAQLIDKGRWVSPLGPIDDAARLGVLAKSPFDVSGPKPEPVERPWPFRES